jgi:hypothetical protein
MKPDYSLRQHGKTLKSLEEDGAHVQYVLDQNFLLEVMKGTVPNHFIIHKFGRNQSVADGSFEIIGNVSGVYPFPAAATTVRVKAGGDADDDATGDGARTILVQGLDENLDLAEEEITLNGVGASTSTTTTFFRIFRSYVLTCGLYATPYNTAAITIENTAGTADLMIITAGESQSQICSYTIPNGYTGYLLSFSASVDAIKAANLRIHTRADISDVTPPVAPSRLRHFVHGVLGVYSFRPASPILALPAATDVWAEAAGGGAITEVSADMEILLVAIL